VEQLATLNKTKYVFLLHSFVLYFMGHLILILLSIAICFNSEAKYISKKLLKKFGG
jgi:hypothetical protein